MKLYLESREISQSYVGGGTNETFYTLHGSHPGGKEGVVEEEIQDVETDVNGNALSGSGLERTVVRLVTPWHSSACDMKKAIRKRLKKMDRWGHADLAFPCNPTQPTNATDTPEVLRGTTEGA